MIPERSNRGGRINLGYGSGIVWGFLDIYIQHKQLLIAGLMIKRRYMTVHYFNCLLIYIYLA
jgi:hypothetical protein